MADDLPKKVRKSFKITKFDDIGCNRPPPDIAKCRVQYLMGHTCRVLGVAWGVRARPPPDIAK